MQRVFLSLLTALAVVALPYYAAAEDGKRPDGPRPDTLVKGGPPHQQHGQPAIHHKGAAEGCQMRKMPPKGPGPQAPMFDARAIFNRLDKNQGRQVEFRRV